GGGGSSRSRPAPGTGPRGGRPSAPHERWHKRYLAARCRPGSLSLQTFSHCHRETLCLRRNHSRGWGGCNRDGRARNCRRPPIRSACEARERQLPIGRAPHESSLNQMVSPTSHRLWRFEKFAALSVTDCALNRKENALEFSRLAAFRKQLGRSNNHKT